MVLIRLGLLAPNIIDWIQSCERHVQIYMFSLW